MENQGKGHVNGTWIEFPSLDLRYSALIRRDGTSGKKATPYSQDLLASVPGGSRYRAGVNERKEEPGHARALHSRQTRISLTFMHQARKQPCGLWRASPARAGGPRRRASTPARSCWSGCRGG